MPKTQTIDAKGNVTITENLGIGDAAGQPQIRQWSFPANQAAAHEKFLGADLSPGDRSALQDVANEANKK